MKTPLLVSLLAAVMALPVHAAERFSLDTRHTFPIFEISHLGFSMQRGRFNKTDGKVMLDARSGTGSIDITIDTASIDMGLDEWDKHMRGEDFFNVEQYPTMTFKSDQVRFANGVPVAAEGTLTLLGVTRPVKLDISNYRCGPHLLNRKWTCGAEVTATLKRSEFGMLKYLPAVGNEVRIAIPVEAFRD